MTESTSNLQQPDCEMLEISLPATLGSVALAIEFTKRSLNEFGCPPGIQASLVVVVDEIVSNIAKFAYDGAEGDFTVQISVKQAGRAIEITFIDEGAAFNPLDSPKVNTASAIENRKIGGQGILITRKIADIMEYERKDGKNLLRICKHIES